MPSIPAQANIAYHILPQERRVITVECNGSLKSLQLLVGGLILYVPAQKLGKNSLIVWEEGIVYPGPHWSHPWLFEGFAQPLVGNGLLVGGQGGTSCKLTHDQVLAKITWLGAMP